MRQFPPELLQAAKTQCWLPEELLRTLVEAEIAARDEANLRIGCAPRISRSRSASTISSWPPPRSRPRPFDYLASLEWVRAADIACRIDRPVPAQSHVPIGCGLAAVEAGLRVR